MSMRGRWSGAVLRFRFRRDASRNRLGLSGAWIWDFVATSSLQVEHRKMVGRTPPQRCSSLTWRCLTLIA